MTIVQKIKQACTYAHVSEAELARRIGTTSSALNQRMKTGKFNDEELHAIASAIGCMFTCEFVFSDGQKF